MMQIITINLPERCLESIQKLTDKGTYRSRSEAIRNALQDFLPKELTLKERLDNCEEEFL